MSTLEHLLENNKRWAARVTAENPGFFAEHASSQAPEFLWIGCSDSRVSANTIVDVKPGDVFVHRNVANLVNHTDMNCLAVIQFAVEALKVKHIIVCGHYGCGGVVASMDGKRRGLIDNWLRHIQDTASHKKEDIEKRKTETERADRLCELNVCQQVINVGETTVVQEAWSRGQNVAVHGWIYDLQNGLINDLDISIGSESQAKDLRQRFFA